MGRKTKLTSLTRLTQQNPRGGGERGGVHGSWAAAAAGNLRQGLAIQSMVEAAGVAKQVQILVNTVSGLVQIGIL